MRAIILGLGLLATPAMAVNQFDLLCKAKKDVVRYRVDLARGEWCAGDCVLVQKFAATTSGVLTFEKTVPRTRRDPESVTEVNRINGSWHTYSIDPSYELVPFVRNGKCEPQDFTGFPAAKF